MKRSHSASRVLFTLLFFLSVSTSQSALATILHVPADYATIQAAIDAAVVGDIVEVACGTYQVPEIIMKSGITLRSATGQADCVVLQPLVPSEGEILSSSISSGTLEGLTFTLGRPLSNGVVSIDGALTVSNCDFVLNSDSGAGSGLSHAIVRLTNSTATFVDCNFSNNWTSAVVSSGAPTFNRCTFSGNSALDYGSGAAVFGEGTFIDCTFSSNRSFFSGGAVSGGPFMFVGCVFRDNESHFTGGAATVYASTFEDCLFTRNYAGSFGRQVSLSGGGALSVGGATSMMNCTFVDNDASWPLIARGSAPEVDGPELHGSAILIANDAVVLLNRVVVFANTGCEAVYAQPSASISIYCSNIFGNPLGDWTGSIAPLLTTNGNISVDPMFCDAANGDFTLSSLSPCLYAECGVMGAFGQGCFHEKPALYQVRDVGNDQGRQVRLTWQRSEHDSPTANPYVTGYGVYRKRDQFAKEAPLPQTARGEGVAILGWDYLGTVPSRGDSVYEMVAPTLCDSTITDGECPSTFFVSAMTSNPFVYYDSPILTGYSLDNLAPPTPTGFAIAYNTGSGNELEWDAVAAGDFAGFKIYRSTQPGALVVSGEYVATTTQTSWTDPDYDGWSVGYEVTSFDMAGNESAPATGGTTTAVPSVMPQQLELLPNVPNPFNPTTRIRFATAAEGPVRVAIYDARGTLIRVLVDKTFPAGHHDAVWDGRDRKGSPVSSGVYLCRLEQRSEFRTRKMVLIK